MTLHFIRHGDTLQNVADQINLENPLYIKEFHNLKCGREDFIVEDLVVGKKLFLPDNSTVQNYNARNDAAFKSPERNPKINFKPENSEENYNVKVTESSFSDGKKKETSFSYIFNLKWIRNEFGYHTFHFSKTNFSNQNQTKIGDLAIACIQSINPIEIQTDFKGEIVKVNLSKEKINDFPKIKDRLLDQFPDQYAKIYIEEFEYAVLNQDVFQKKMKEDWLLKTFFAPFRNEFKNGKCSFMMFLEDKNSVEIQQTGILNIETDEIALSQTAMSDDHTEKGFSGELILSATTGIIKSTEIQNSYSQYGILYSTELKVTKI